MGAMCNKICYYLISQYKEGASSQLSRERSWVRCATKLLVSQTSLSLGCSRGCEMQTEQGHVNYSGANEVARSALALSRDMKERSLVLKYSSLFSVGGGLGALESLAFRFLCWDAVVWEPSWELPSQLSVASLSKEAKLHA